MIQDVEFSSFLGASACYNSDQNIDCQRAVNFMPEAIESPGRKVAYVLRPTPGYVLEKDFENPIRAIYKASRGFGENEVGQSLIIVAGPEIWWKNSNTGVWELIGSINSGTGLIAICDDGIAMLICDGAYAFRVVFETKEITQLVRNEDIFIEPHTCAVVGGYTVISGRETTSTDKESIKFYVSELLDNSKFAALDYFTADSFFGEIRALAAAGGLQWLLGADGVEAWQVTGNANMPLAKVSGMFFAGCGLIGRGAFAVGGDSLFWLGQGGKGNAVAYIIESGTSPKRVSTIPVEEEWRKYNDLQEVSASHYATGGHSFYLLSFKQSNKTWVYDIYTGLWHERQSGPAGKRRVWDPSVVCGIGADTYGANKTGKLYTLATPEYGECGESVLRKRTSPAVDTKERKARHLCLTLSMQAGTGNVKLMLKCSDDNGYTWGGLRTMMLGKIGQYARLAQFRLLGMARRRVYELEVSDPVGVAIVRAEMTIDISEVRS